MIRPREWIGLLGVLVALVLGFGAATDHFLTWTTAVAIANQAPESLIVATGMTLVVITGGIDLSVGSMLASGAAPLPLAAVAGVLVGTACGAANGWMTTRWQLPSFVVTLAMLEIARGATYLVTDSQTRYLGTSVDPVTSELAFGLRLPVLVAVVVVIAGQLLLTRVSLGRYLVAVGANDEAAHLAGVSPRRVRTVAFTLAGAMAGVAAVLQAGRLAAADPNAGIGLELEAIAAVVIGGASLMGGRGTIWGTLVGLFLIQTLNNGLDLLLVPSYWQSVIKGGLIAAAVAVDVFVSRRRI